MEEELDYDNGPGSEAFKRRLIAQQRENPVNPTILFKSNSKEIYCPCCKATDVDKIKNDANGRKGFYACPYCGCEWNPKKVR